jgi:predicted dehydrogenase
MIRIALLGAGHIAGKMGATLAAIRDEVVPYAVASRDLAKAQALATRFGFEKAYGSYLDMVRDPAVDLVYIGTPNSHHFDHIRLCLEHGKHVLCEKPFTCNAGEAAILFALAREKGLLLQEAIWTRFLPATRLLRETIASGEIGAPRFLEAAFSVPILAKERVIRPELGGGALLDLGIYPLTFALQHFGEDYADLTGSAVLTDTGVDEQETFVLRYRDGRMAALTSSLSAFAGAFGRISGSAGRIEIDVLVRCEGFRVVKPDGTVRAVSCPFEHTGYEYEVRACAAAIAAGKPECDEAPQSSTLAALRAMDALRASWGVRFPTDP